MTTQPTRLEVRANMQLTDEQIIERCKAAGIKWIPPELPDDCDYEMRFPGSFDMVSMSEMRALLSASKPAAPEDAHSDAPLSLIPDLVKLNETAVSTALSDMGDAQTKWRAEVQMYREITPLALSAYSDGYEAGIAAILRALAAPHPAQTERALTDERIDAIWQKSHVTEHWNDHDGIPRSMRTVNQRTFARAILAEQLFLLNGELSPLQREALRDWCARYRNTNLCDMAVYGQELWNALLTAARPASGETET